MHEHVNFRIKYEKNGKNYLLPTAVIYLVKGQINSTKMSSYSILFCFTDSCLRLQSCFIHIKLRVLKRLWAVFDRLQLTCRKRVHNSSQQLCTPPDRNLVKVKDRLFSVQVNSR